MRRLPFLAAALVALGTVAGPAAANPVGAGQLAWTQTNIFDGGGCNTTDINCTFLGFVTGPPPSPFGDANGEATSEAPATGGPVTPDSDRGLGEDYTFTYAGTAGGAYDPATRTGTLEYDGLVRFKAPIDGAPVMGPQFDMTVNDPQITLDGTTGVLRADGVNADAGTSYDRSGVVFDLDLSDSTYTRAGNTVTIDNIYPRVATEGYAFPTGYGTPGQDDRVPPTFGLLTLTIQLGPNVSVTPVADLNPLGQTLTVTGTDASKSTPGLYVFLSAASAAPTDQTAAPTAPNGDAFTWLRQSGIDANGAFSTTIVARSPFQTGGGAVDCALVPCVVRTIAAHYDADRSQDTATPVGFGPAPAATPSPSPAPSASPSPTATPDYSVPKPPKPKLTKITLTRKRVGFTLSRKAKVTGTIKRKGKTVRKVKANGRKGRNARAVKRLRPGRYRVALKPKGGTTRVKVVRLKRAR